MSANELVDPINKLDKFRKDLVVTDDKIDEFPLHLLIPKHTTRQPEFLRQNPEWDGRGQVIAVLDQGVDLACPGLQVTSTGEPKIVDAVNFSGAGDVVTTEVRKPENGIIVGLSGRKLKIPETWQNPSNEFRLGLKPLFELYPSDLVDRIKTDRLQNDLNKAHNPKITENMKNLNEHIKSVGQNSTKNLDKWARKDLKFKFEYIRDFGEKTDFGPVLDCLVWNDGTKWRACLDTTFEGDLAKCKVMTNFRDEREWGILGEKDGLSYCLAIRNNGDLLEICTPSGTHGTHVAHIAAAHYPDQPSCSGIAPGAQIVSIVIGDHRNQSRSLGQSFSRAINYCAEIGVDMVNFSYGANHTQVHSKGSLLKYLEKMVYDHKIPFLASAGNEGPALTSLCDPAAQSSAVISVGAFVPEDMGEFLYGTAEQKPTTMFHFSSRGPASDGRLGINFSAPGAAMAGMPLYSLNSAEVKNGTSMACPSVTGTAACLYSAAKVLSIPMSPFKLRLALENSAKLPADSANLTKLDVGHGLVDTVEALELLKKMDNIPNDLVDLKVFVGHASKAGSEAEKRGIYIRDPYQLDHYTDYNITLEPTFKTSSDLTQHNFQKKIRLQSNADFIQHTRHVLLSNNSTKFQVRVDPTKLESGQVHFTEILGYDVDAPSDIGPLIRVPITIIKPEEIDDENSLTRVVTLKSGQPHRTFLKCPPNSTEVTVKVKSLDKKSVTKLYVNFAQKIAAGEDYEYHNIEPRETITLATWVKDRASLEFVSILDWVGFENEQQVQFDFEFCGYHAELPNMNTGPVVEEIKLYNDVAHQTLSPNIYFSSLRRMKLPEKFEIVPIEDRVNFMDNTKLYALYLTYHIKAEAQTIRFGLPGVADYYYGNPVDCLYMKLFDGQRYIRPYNNREYRYLVKGDYRMEVRLRSNDPKLLESFTSAALEVKYKINKITLPIYNTYQNALNKGSNTLSSLAMRPGQMRTLYANFVLTEKLPSFAQAGDSLCGILTLTSNDPGEVVNMSLSAFPKTAMNNNTRVCALKGGSKEKKSAEETLKESIRDLQINYMKTCSDDLSDITYNTLITQFPDHHPIKLARLNALYGRKTRDLTEMKKLAEEIIDSINVNKVLQFAGSKSENDEQLLNVTDEYTLKKNQLLETYRILLDAYLDSYLEKKDNVPKAFKNRFKLSYDVGYAEKLEQFEGSWVDFKKFDWEKEIVQVIEKAVKEQKKELNQQPVPVDKVVEVNVEDNTFDGLHMKPLSPSNFPDYEFEYRPRVESICSSSITKDSGVELCEMDQEEPSEASPKAAVTKPQFTATTSVVKAETIMDSSIKLEDLKSEDEPEPKEEKAEFIVTLEMLDKTLASYSQLANLKSDEYRVIRLKHALAHDLHGLALKRILKLVQSKQSRVGWQVLYELADQLGWDLISERWRDVYLHRYCIPKRVF